MEDHPLEYGSFQGTIPAGEYGGGQVSIWDKGTYQPEKWRDREVMVVLHGKRAKGRYVLFPTNGKNWMIHRMDPAPKGFEPLPADLSPMLATAGELPLNQNAKKGEWAYEFKWDGLRVLLWIDGGRPRAESRNGNDMTVAFPELRDLAEAVGSDQVLLDGELVALDDEGRPRFSRLQHRMHISSAQRRNGRRGQVPGEHDRLRRLAPERPLAARLGLRRAPGDPRGPEALGPELGGDSRVHRRPGRPGDAHRGRDRNGRRGLQAALEHLPAGVRSRDWIKTKHVRTQEVVVGGWSDGQGERKSTFGALLLGIPEQDPAAERTSARNKSAPGSPSRATGPVRLTYVGKVGTGFTESDRRELLARLTRRSTSPFGGELPSAVTRGAHWVRPDVVGEVSFTEWTPDGVLRHPVWRGERVDKSVKQVVREP